MPKIKDRLELIRHSLSHLLAASVLEQFPKAKLGIGPVIDDGFYYDFLLPQTLSDTDLPRLEKRMRELIKQNLPFTISKTTPAAAQKIFSDQPFKLELISELKRSKTPITIYKTGSVFTDLCSGPHVKNTREIPIDGFKLWKTAGAYWQGDSKKKMLTRVYGLAFSSKKELAAKLAQLAEAARRDHRKLGQELDLFTFSPLVGSGLPLFTPKGTIIREELERLVRELQTPYGYSYVRIPHLTKPELYKTSGHWDKFKDDLFHVQGKSDSYVIKPMNCPHHTQIFASQPRSYRDLPIRYAEFTAVYRDEQAGELQGLSRVLAITQDDGHIFCRESQIGPEIANLIKIVKKLYQIVKMPLEIHLSTHDPKHFEKYLGDQKTWKQSIYFLKKSLHANKMAFTIDPGEAAFYGPKIDFVAKDSLGRSWQVATIQVDFNMPRRFGLAYTDENGQKQTPVMLHRAFLGSVERFMSVMIEHYAGAFPVWLAPVQARLLPIGDRHHAYANRVKDALATAGIRVEIDSSGDTIGKKIRNAETQKIPFILIVGTAEQKTKTVSVRRYGRGDTGSIPLDDLLAKLTNLIAKRQ